MIVVDQLLEADSISLILEIDNVQMGDVAIYKIIEGGLEIIN